MNKKINNRINQREFRERQKKLGNIQVTVWIPVSKKDKLKQIVENLNQQGN